MSHYDIDYSKLPEPEKHNKAIQDIKDWMGVERFDKITELFKQNYPTGPGIDQFNLMCAFVGVSGYPVKAWYNLIWPL